MRRNEDSLRDLWDNIKHTNIQIIVIPEEEEKEKEPEKISEEIIIKNFPNLRKKIVNQVQEARGLIQKKFKETYTKNILTKLIKIKYKQQILKTVREKQPITLKGIPIRLSANFSPEKLQATRKWQDIFKVMKGKAYKNITLPSRDLIQIRQRNKKLYR